MLYRGREPESPMNDWLNWAKQIKAISQIGLAYGKDPYDLQRYRQLQAVAHRMFARLADAPVARIEHFFVPERGYMTPKVDLRAGVFRDDRVLLVQERSDGRWSLPGGWADVNESPRQGIEREILEESGYRARVVRLVAIKDRSLHDYRPQHPDHLFKLFFLCELQGGRASPNLEVSAVDFFPLDGLPPLSTNRVLAEDIALLAEHRAEPGRPVYCD